MTSGYLMMRNMQGGSRKLDLMAISVNQTDAKSHFIYSTELGCPKTPFWPILFRFWLVSLEPNCWFCGHGGPKVANTTCFGLTSYLFISFNKPSSTSLLYNIFKLF